MDGEIGISLKSISGGEGSSADLAVDLSVVKFIGEQTGKGINVMLLDEFTNGLDTVCIQDTIEMLKNFSIDKKLLLIEHNPIVAQSFENKITVVRDGLTSKIVQQ
jgi:ABC-type multidrug transport system ATPase subunit